MRNSILMIAVICTVLVMFSFTACVDNAAVVQEDANETSQPSGTVTADSMSDTTTADVQFEQIPDEAATTSPEEEDGMQKLILEVGGETFNVTLRDNETAKAFTDMLPLTLEMSELNGNEKYYYLDDILPTDSQRPSRITEGDIMLYGSSCLVLFYESFSTSYSYTPIGRIDDPSGLAEVLGRGSVEVTLRID